MKCPECNKQMKMVEAVSMGSGYREFEDLTPEWRCKCGYKEEIKDEQEMARCPHCKKEISRLILEGYAFVTLHPNGSYGDQDVSFDDCNIFSCPECSFQIANSHKEAVAFLNPEGETKNPNNPNPQVGLPSLFPASQSHQVYGLGKTWVKAATSEDAYEYAKRVERDKAEGASMMFHSPEDEEWQLAEYLPDQNVWFIGDAIWNDKVGEGRVSYDERPEPIGKAKDLISTIKEMEAYDIWLG